MSPNPDHYHDNLSVDMMCVLCADIASAIEADSRPHATQVGGVRHQRPRHIPGTESASKLFKYFNLFYYCKYFIFIQ